MSGYALKGKRKAFGCFADSDTLIVKGILGALLGFLDGQAPEEIAVYEPRFLSETALKENISNVRATGFAAIIHRCRELAREAME